MPTKVIPKKHGLVSAFIRRFVEFRITGLDISDLSMKYMSFDRAKKNKISIGAYGEIEYPQGVISKGEIKDEQKMTQILREWHIKEKKNLPSPFVAISLPEEKSFIRAVQIPHVKRTEIANAIRWEIENQIPLPLEDVSYDYEVMEPSEENQDHLDVIITAFPRDMLDAYVRVIKGAGLEPYAAELESQSLVRACAPSLHDTQASIIVDVGRTRTSLVLFANTAILYTSTIESGGLIFEEHIARQLNVGIKEAQEMKINIGLDNVERNGDVFTALAPAITTIGDELVRATSYYQTHTAHVHNATPAIERILLSGGDANLKGLDTYLASVLRIRVERADPFLAIKDKLAYEIPPLTRRDALAYATAIGVALREIRQD